MDLSSCWIHPQILHTFQPPPTPIHTHRHQCLSSYPPVFQASWLFVHPLHSIWNAFLFPIPWNSAQESPPPGSLPWPPPPPPPAGLATSGSHHKCSFLLFPGYDCPVIMIPEAIVCLSHRPWNSFKAQPRGQSIVGTQKMFVDEWMNEFFWDGEPTGCHSLWKCCCCSVTKSCLTLVTTRTVAHQALLEWVAISFSKGSSQPRDQTWVSCFAGRFFTIWAIREDPLWKWDFTNFVDPHRS